MSTMAANSVIDLIEISIFVTVLIIGTKVEQKAGGYLTLLANFMTVCAKGDGKGFLKDFFFGQALWFTQFSGALHFCLDAKTKQKNQDSISFA